MSLSFEPGCLVSSVSKEWDLALSTIQTFCKKPLQQSHMSTPCLLRQTLSCDLSAYSDLHTFYRLAEFQQVLG